MHLLIVLFILTGCVSINKDTHQAIFLAPYDVVWQSILLTMKHYPLTTEDVENGEIETSTISGYSAWKPPKGMIYEPSKRKYRIKIFLERGEIGSKQAIKVHVIKDEIMDKNFIERSIPITSSGIEEEVILYRINREILLEKQKNKMKKRQKLRKE